MNDAQNCRLETIEDGRVLSVTLDHAPGNTITPEMMEVLETAVFQLEDSCSLRLAILQGSGTSFSKGFDLSVIGGRQNPGNHRQDLLLENDVLCRMAASRKPWIAAINGHCLGGGLELALACQFRLCAESARLGLPELGQGFLPGWGGVHRLTKLVGRARALDMILAGVFVSAQEALQSGLVHRVLPKQGFGDGVAAFVRGLLTVEPQLVAEVLRLTELAERLGDQDCVAATVESIVRQRAGSRSGA